MTDTCAYSQDGVTRNVYTVSELNLEARALLEENFPRIWVEGEISNLARPRSGHIYFSLKDDRCQLRCAMFRMHNRRIDFIPEDGMQVLAQGRISLYPERGDYQLIVQFLEEAGAGALRRAFEALKQRLAGEGLFDEAHKRPLPSLPRQIGVVTSPTGAALRDILSILARRFPAIPVLIYPVPVQGAGAATDIARMLDAGLSDDGHRLGHDRRVLYSRPYTAWRCGSLGCRHQGLGPRQTAHGLFDRHLSGRRHGRIR